MERKVRTGRLKKGMYVSNLDRPWLDTPFLMQGFFITDNEDLKALDKYCDYVVIDTDRGIEADIYWDEGIVLPTNEYLEKFLRNRQREVDYQDEHDVGSELPVAKKIFENAIAENEQFLNAIKKGVKLNVRKAQSLIEPLIDSILRNPDAMIWLSHLREKDELVHAQAIEHCVLAIVFARYMGLPKADMFELGLGVLFFDIGKLNVSMDLLYKKTRLTDVEFAQVQRHVDDGIDYLMMINDFPEASLNTVLTHHERYDGSGYPNKLKAHQIPVFGRIAAIVDCYQAMISKRSYSDAISAHTALQKIYSWRNLYFQNELVEQFLRCMGVYPTGSLLEMKSGEVGIVLSQHREKHIKPVVMILLDKNKQALNDYQVVDLAVAAAEQNKDQVKSVEILRGLDPGAYGIEPSDFYP